MRSKVEEVDLLKQQLDTVTKEYMIADRKRNEAEVKNVQLEKALADAQENNKLIISLFCQLTSNNNNNSNNNSHSNPAAAPAAPSNPIAALPSPPTSE